MNFHPVQRIVLIDFDGTITLEDSSLFLLEQHGTGNWRQFDDLLIQGKISLEECLSKQFSSIKITRDKILKILDKEISFRPGFREFLDFCKQSRIPVKIVSAGLDFVIEHFLKKIEAMNQISVVSGISKFTSGGISFVFPQIKHKTSRNFKEDLVINLQKNSYVVIYIGDGSGDFYAAEKADTIYAVDNSDLSRMCREQQLNFNSFLDFNTIIHELSKL
jgi:2,3-diketo-5-methylthio-1-phosphopentane phosphatase